MKKGWIIWIIIAILIIGLAIYYSTEYYSQKSVEDKNSTTLENNSLDVPPLPPMPPFPRDIDNGTNRLH